MRNSVSIKFFFSFVFISLLLAHQLHAQIDTKINDSLSGQNDTVVSTDSTGYHFISRMVDAAPAVKVTTRPFNKGLCLSPLELITGRISGLSITPESGVPGSGFQVVNRGINSLYYDSSPLIIVDGVITADEILNLNPGDIESITVMKDAMAASIYGEQAANGAIILKTKTGSKEVRVNYTGKAAFSAIAKKIDIFSAEEFRRLIMERYANNPTAIGLIGNASTDWQKEIYHIALGQDHHIAVSGSVKGIPVRGSIGRTDQGGILKTSSFNRTSFAFSADPKLFGDHLKIGLRLQGTHNNDRIANETAVYNAVHFDPTQPVHNSGAYGGYFTWTNGNGPNQAAPANPLALLELTDNSQKTNRIIGNLNIDYALHFLPDMKLVLNLGEDSYTAGNSLTYDTAASWTYYYGKGISQKSDKTNRNRNLDVCLNFKRDFNHFVSNIDISIGYSVLSNFTSVEHYLTSNASPGENQEYARNSFTNNQNALYTRLNFSLWDRLTINLCGRQDANSRYALSDRKQLSFIGHLELKTLSKSYTNENNLLTEINLVAGYGNTGSLSSLPVGFNYTFDAGLKHEKVVSGNLGLKFGLLGNRINGSIEWYSRTGDDLMVMLPVPGNNYMLTNGAKIRNRGTEMTLNTNLYQSNKLRWDFSFNLAANSNKVLSLGPGSNNPDYLGIITGSVTGPIGTYVQIQSSGYPLGSFYVYQQVYDENGKPLEGLYADRNDDGLITERDRYHYQKTAPDILMGIWSNLQYANWDFSFSGRISLGNYVYNNVNSLSAFNRLYSTQVFLSNISTSVYNSGFELPQYLSDYYIKDASFCKIDFLSLGYSFRNVWKDKLSFRISLNAQHAFTLTKYSGQDPEVADGLDGYSYPRSRTFSIELSADF